MQRRYYLSHSFNNLGFVIFGVVLAVFVFDFTNVHSSIDVALSVLVFAVLLALLWFTLRRGTYITIDNDDNLYNTFLFIKRDVIPLSQILSLSTRHPLLLSRKVPIVWNTFYDKKGKPVTKSLISRPALSEGDFRDLIERIHKTNPKIEIAEELLK